MKKLITLIIVASLALTIQAQTGDITNTLGTTGGDFIIESTTEGILIPKMTEAERDAITTPATGLMIYQTDATAGFYHYDGTNWVANGSTGTIAIDDLSDAKTQLNSVYVGKSAGAAGTSDAVDNTAVGSFALKDISTGDFNTAVGSAAGFALTTEEHNTFLGYKAGFSAEGSSNIGIGSNAISNVTGDENVALTIGTANLTSGSGNIIIGKVSTDLASVTADNQMNIGNTIYATGMTTAGVKVGIGNGNNAPTSTLDVDGSMTLAINSGTSTYTLTDSDYTYITNSSTANGADVTLPTASGITGRVYIVKNTGAASQLVKANSGETIDVATDYTLLQWEFVKVQSDGTNWIVIGSN